MDVLAFLDELVKLGAISDEEAQKSVDRLERLEQQKPTLGQAGRYAALGAVAGPAIGALSNVVTGKPWHGGAKEVKQFQKLRGVAGSAVKGSLASGAIPLVRSSMDRGAEAGKLRQYMRQEHIGEYAKNPASPAGPPNFERME